MRVAAPAAVALAALAVVAAVATAASEVDENTFRKNELQTAEVRQRQSSGRSLGGGDDDEGVSLEHVVGFAPEMLDDLDNHLSTEGVEANAQTALAEERMDHFVEFENETMIAEESIPISMMSYAMPRPAPKLRLSNHRGHFRGGRLRVSESRRMVNHGPNPKSQVVVGAGGRKYTPLEQNLKDILVGNGGRYRTSRRINGRNFKTGKPGKLYKNKYDRQTGTGLRPNKKYKGKKGLRKRLPVPPSQKPQLTSSAAASLYSTAIVGDDGESCKKYTEDICIATENYPREAILAVLNRNARVGNDLIADVVDQSADSLVDGVTSAQENAYTFDHYFGQDSGNDIERQDNGLAAHRDFAGDGGFLCPSEIMYAKPKRGKTAQGEWKDIVNVKDYTQTLRMEKCLKPGGQCSYVSHHYKSQCSQVYNYHRLLSWNKERGLHMDIYKVPTCCSCHIMGYSYVYPPLGGKSRPKKHSHSFEHHPHPQPHHDIDHDFDYDFDNDLFRHEEESFDDFHVEHMQPHFTPSPHDDGHGFKNFMTHHTGFDSRQSPSSVHVTVRPPTASGEDEFIVPEQHLKRRSGNGGSSAQRRPRTSPPSGAATTPTPAASGGTSYRRYRTLGGGGGSSQRSSVKRRRMPVKGRQRAPVSAPLLGGPPISASSHVVSSASGQSKTVPPPPPPPPHAPKTAQLSQPHHHPPAPPPPRRRTRPPTPSSSTVVAASERIDDYSDDYILEGESDEDETDSEGKKKKVNYGYHPIIDFFPMYRWSAAAAAAAAAAKK